MNSIVWILALLGSALISLLAWLFQRAISGVDKKVEDTCTQMGKAVEAIQQMRIEMTGYNQLVQYLSNDVKELKKENGVLRESHHTFDKFIAVQQALHKLPPNPSN